MTDTRRRGLIALMVCATTSLAQAQQVALQGMLGRKALLIVNGTPPKSVAAGETHAGVTVLSTAGDEAVIEINGLRHTLRVGEAPSSVGGTLTATGNRIVLSAESGGHFFANGQINKRPVRFMVDTGATTIALGAAEAQRIGLDYRSGQVVQLGTANGVTRGWRIKLSSVRIGDVEVHEVDAIVSPQPMPFVLLGNSFLTRFQMKRENDQMVLERRF